jgi:hypothetical protein
MIATTAMGHNSGYRDLIKLSPTGFDRRQKIKNRDGLGEDHHGISIYARLKIVSMKTRFPAKDATDGKNRMASGGIRNDAIALTSIDSPMIGLRLSIRNGE